MCGGRGSSQNALLSSVFLLGDLKVTGISTFKEQSLAERVFQTAPKKKKKHKAEFL